ncbi:restriction endonuclease subunit S [Pseudochrobactrum sp. AO18b]|uniref:restriction endonuclease subunit S n=1 Tax=Pseudochrobactrum sp. AO18b TaxID=1201036 RepID=UPI0003A7B4A2|nr:restriction endonuclease subunit S [Pseudochrobactrum sp. AO18b]
MSFVKLGELVSIQTGKLDANAASFDGQYPFFTCAREPLRISSWSYDMDAVLVAGNGDLNVKHYVGKFDAYQRTYILYPKNKHALETRYLYHFMEKYLDKLRYQSIGGVIKYIKLGMITEVLIPLPHIDEQKRIAAILDKADQLRQKRRQAIALLDSLTQSIFLKMFGDPVSNPMRLPAFKLADVADFFAGNSLPEGIEFQGQDSGYLLLKVSDLNRPENTDRVKIAASFSEKPGSRAGTAPEGAIVFPKRGGAIATNKKRTLGRSAILDPNLMGVAPNAKHMNSIFLAAWFRFLDLASISSGSSVPQLNKQDLAPLVINVPSLQQQEEYGMRIEDVSRLSSHAAKSLDGAQMLFSSLQHRAFSGQL